MDLMGRRHFGKKLGTAVLGLSVAVVAGCSTTDGGVPGPTATAAGGAGALLAGVSMRVRTDPG
jgi:hypothetical protein